MHPFLDLDFIRGLYPAECWDKAFFENAGGSFVPECVIGRVSQYMRETQVQPGAAYAASAKAAERMAEGQRLMAEMVGARADEVIIGPSTTMNVFVLSKAFGAILDPGGEIIVTNLDHEANIGAWRRLTDQGAVIREWTVNPETETLDLDALDALLTDKTRLVCFSHCSNVLGGINDARAITQKAHDAGALVCVDGVAFAPHRAVDVKALDADFYLVSLYKVFGPHVSLLYAKREHLERLPGQNHFFLDDQIPLKMNPGGPSHEFTSALVGVADYFEALAAHHLPEPPNTFKGRVDALYGHFAGHEQALAGRFLDFLTAKKGVRLLGPKTGDAALRAPTFSFTVEGRPAADIPALLASAHVAISHGHFYAKRLVEALGVTDPAGVVRASMVHYNTLEEVDRLIEGLDGAI